MTTNSPIEIPLSKKKNIIAFVGSLVLIVIGFWLLVNPPKSDNPILNNRILLSIVGLASILFFSFTAIVSLRKYLDSKPGLVINQQGIVDNSSGVSVGLVPWSDIEEIKISQVMNQKFLMFIVSNPQIYIERVTNPLKRKIMEVNYKNYGSPISISSNSLQTDFNSLYSLLTEKMQEYKK